MSAGMSKHTKGPWTATQSDPAEGCDLWWITACPAANQEKEIATVPGGYPHERHEANARLIAAAPDLLEMLVEAHDIIDAIGQPETAEVAARMRATIAKAKGEE